MNTAVNKQTSVTTYVFRDDLVKGGAKRIPGKYLDILLDVPRPGCAERHDLLEKVIGRGAGLRDGRWAETLEVAPNTVLLFDAKRASDKLLEKAYQVDGGDVGGTRRWAVDARDSGRIGLLVENFLGDDPARDTKVVPIESPVEDDKAPSELLLLVGKVDSDLLEGGGKVKDDAFSGVVLAVICIPTTEDLCPRCGTNVWVSRDRRPPGRMRVRGRDAVPSMICGMDDRKALIWH